MTTPTERCPTCGREFAELEPAFRWPDALFAVPEEERELRVRKSNDFVSIDGEAFFIRGVAPVPVEGRDEPYSWGFWVKVAKEHFEEYDRFFSVDPPPDHPGFRGSLANQTRYLPPSTLGCPVHVALGKGKERPRIMLLDDSHALAKQQVQGVTHGQVHEWSGLFAPREDPLMPNLDPPAPPFTASLEENGWLIARPQELGRQVEEVGVPPRPGDLVKCGFVYWAADSHGEAVQRVEFMWVLLDEIREDGWWSGTLNNSPFVPGTIEFGSRLWLRAEQVIGLMRAERDQPVPAADPSADSAGRTVRDRLAGWWRRVRGSRGRGV